MPDEDDEASVANIMASIMNDEDEDSEDEDEDESNNSNNNNDNGGDDYGDAPGFTAASQTQPDSQYSRNAFASQK